MSEDSNKEPLYPVNSGDGKEPRKHLKVLLEARGIGVEMAKGIDPDEYIRQLREGWEEREQFHASIYAEIEAQKAISKNSD